MSDGPGARGSLRVLALGLVAAACRGEPAYPACSDDRGCARDGRRERCVLGRCQACQATPDCPAGHRCLRQRCVRGLDACERDGDCLATDRCHRRRCAPRPECGVGLACPGDGRCEDGVCVASGAEEPPALVTRELGPCALESPYFAFNDSTLDELARRALQRDAACLLRLPAARFVLLGRGDPRGAPEYNEQLGERRAHTVLTYLQSLGVPAVMFRVAGSREGGAGTDEASWRFDRRVDFQPLGAVPRR